jgi:hypothetical protein
MDEGYKRCTGEGKDEFHHPLRQPTIFTTSPLLTVQLLPIMRFFTLISTCSFLVSATAGHLPTPVQRSPNPDGLTLLSKRQFPIGPVDLTLCATVNADVDIGARLPLNLLSLPILTQLGLVIGQTTNVRLTEK